MALSSAEVRVKQLDKIRLFRLFGQDVLNELAKEAVGQWKYRPVIVDGRVVPVVKVVAVPFLGSEGRRFP